MRKIIPLNNEWEFTSDCSEVFYKAALTISAQGEEPVAIKFTNTFKEA